MPEPWIRAIVVGALLGPACAPRPEDPAPDAERSAPCAAPGPTPEPAPSTTPVTAPAPEPPPTLPDELQPVPGQGTVAAGDSLSRILHRAGLDAQAVHALTVALEGTFDPNTIQVGQRYRIELDEQRQLRAFELELDDVVRVRAERDEQGTLLARRIVAETQTVEVPVAGSIRSSLWAAITGAGEHPSLVSFLVDVFAYDLDFHTDTHPGDTFRLVVERIELDGEFIEYGRVLAAEYAGKAGTFRVFWHEPASGEPRYVDDEGRGVSRTLLKTPLKFSRVSSEFNPRRMHPILHREKGHNGVDYAAPEGTPVWAAADGRITVRDLRKGAGNMVVLAHANGMSTLYMHLSRFADGQKVGSPVRAKTVIGYVGMTGLATGPHLHFGLKVHGRYVDPQQIKQHRGPGVAKRDGELWKRERARRLEQLDAVAAPQASADP